MMKHHKATASDVAEKAGVSKWTVSRAFTPGASISDSARESVLAAAAELGYRPNLLARSLSQKRTHIIGVAIDEMKNPHSMMMLDMVTKQLQTRGYMALLLNITAGENYRAVMAMADQLQVDGILFLATVLTKEWAAIAQDLHQIPLVQVCRNTESEHIDVVNIDGYRAGEEIAALLIEQGHRRFGYMKGPDTQSSHLLRMEGYRDKLMAAGFQLDRVLTAGHYDRQRGFQLMSEYLQATPESERVEALFCENDVLALGALGALEALRQTAPSSAMAVVGFDDIDEAGSANWALTSYSQRIDRLVEEALNRLIDNRATADGAWRHGELRVRRSHVKQDEIQIAD
ncbi:TPA: LacI family DNA-binding transcriptional regulator [Serratia marcescens]|nr:LacI family DNA-binding transcriptional regulator [Serratia marcescens]HAU4318350.1 LacI family DNA-binding transcriptional regulator [Serratia marcescens]